MHAPAAVPWRLGSSIPADPRELVFRARSCLGVRVALGRDVSRGALTDVAFRFSLEFGAGCLPVIQAPFWRRWKSHHRIGGANRFRAQRAFFRSGA